MTEGLEAVTTAALTLALDAANLRQQAQAINIANAGTPGFVPLRVNFESQLEEARSALESRGRLDAASLADVRPELEREAAAGGGLSPQVALDVEVAAMSANAAHYQALLKIASKHYALLAAAVSDGKK